MARPLRAAVAAALLAAAGARADDRPWYLPDHTKLQLAGNVGFLSPGVGWALGRTLDADLLLGWVPEGIGGTDIFSMTAKLTAAPWRLDRGPWQVRPFTAALQVTYTFGDHYFVFPRFPFPPTALRSGLAFGAGASRPMGGHRVGLYAELVALDVPLVYWLTNRRALGPQDVFSLALGARLDF